MGFPERCARCAAAAAAAEAAFGQPIADAAEAASQKGMGLSMEYRRRVEPNAVERGLMDGLLAGLALKEAAATMKLSDTAASERLARLRDNRGFVTLYQLLVWYGCRKAGHPQNPLE